ncbi:MAG: septum formation initiator family protein [bacterium]
MKYTDTAKQEKSWYEKIFSGSSVGNLVIIGLVIYLSIILIRSVIGNYAINQEISRSYSEIDKLEQTNQDLEKQINYFKSDTFKEIEARAKLGYQKPGEKVIILPRDKESSGDSDNTDSLSNLKRNNKPPNPNYLDWWQIFFES